MHFRDFDSRKLPRNHKEFLWLDAASRTGGGVWRLPLLYVTGKADGPTLVVIAGVHGDEYEGPEAIPHVFQQVEPETLSGTLLMMPVCNMPAYEAGTRSSPIDGLNLARVLPGNVEGSITQVIGYWVTEKLMMVSDFFIDLHSGGVALNIPTQINYFHTDDEIGKRSYAGARAFGAPVLVGSRDPSKAVYGCSFRTTWDRHIPALFTEGPGGGRTRLEDVACYADGVLNVAKWLGMMPGEPKPRPLTHHLVGDGKPGGSYSATVAGYFRREVETLDYVTVGQRLGVVQDFGGQVLQDLIATREGFVTMLHAVPCVNVGDALVSLTPGTRY